MTVPWAYVAGFIYIGCLQALKRPMYGFVEAVVRKIILPFSVFYLVVIVMDVGLAGFWWSSVMINVVMAIVTVVYTRWVLKQLYG